MKLKKIGMMITTVAVVAGLSVPVFATSGKLTFSHGINKSAETTFGSTTSTAFEDTMQIKMMVKNSTSGVIKSYSTPVISNARYLRLTKDVEGVKGSSYCYYYVDGVKKHESTAWYNFDFR